MPHRHPTVAAFRRGLHFSRAARQRYGLDDWLFGVRGRIVFVDFHAARLLAERINVRRDAARHPDRAVRASHLNAIGLIHEVAHLLIADHRRRSEPRLLGRLLAELERRLGRDRADRLLHTFVDSFPPPVVYRGEQTTAGYLGASSDGEPNREVALEELLLLWLANENPACAAYRELFDDGPLRADTAYLEAIDVVRGALGEGAPVAATGRNLLDELLEPMRAAPDSLGGQLDYIRRRWAVWLGPLTDRLLRALDFVAEEHRAVFPPGPGPVFAPSYAGLDAEYEAYSHDLDWMPRLVLLAKNVHVWLAQLSRASGSELTSLDQIPDAELDRLARWGISGLWLIGVWQRSRASQLIKRMMGDHDAVASAYSLLDYRIADDLGGQAAFDDLKRRAGQRGIRMATDMVPNHVGIDSRWVIEHPDWFVSLPRSPFPGYRFTGEDLCDDERVGIYLEDHYRDRSDAAVVFRRVDHWTGDERFIYHGNDGTSMPWNDTAQLDYTNPEVREAVIRTILHVARLSPVIRFDAAMTLTRRHYHRLWYPEPGSGGDIPSRAEFGMTRAAFDSLVPREFWREVVDRVAAEAPDTLLLAEAFWLLEGYFVRTLGMHRVYNSAFMNMLRDERNAEYRQLIKNTLEFDPRILKRYVNFMSNPDERTAVDQFGTDDKYFGVATLMATLPGLPMFAHGQIEGYAEKYGMEFYRPRWDEQPNTGLIQRHERQLFPLLHRRRLFAEVDDFLLYDFLLADGSVDENVFAYSNRRGGERALVVYHNRYAETSGWIRTSVAVRRPDGGLARHALVDGLAVDSRPESFVAFRDAVTGLEYLRSCRQLADDGLYAELAAYDLHVFVGFRVLDDDGSGRLARVCDRLAGRGVESVDDELAELEHGWILEPFGRLLGAPALDEILAVSRADAAAPDRSVVVDRFERGLAELLAAVADRRGATAAAPAAAEAARQDLERVLTPAWSDELPASGELATALGAGDPAAWGALVGWLVARRIGELVQPANGATAGIGWFDDWRLGRALSRSLRALGVAVERAQRAADSVRLMLAGAGWYRAAGSRGSHLRRLCESLLADPALAGYLGVNRYRDVLWYHAESFDEALGWLAVVAVVEADGSPPPRVAELLATVAAARDASGYRVDALLDGLDRPAADSGASPTAPSDDRPSEA